MNKKFLKIFAVALIAFGALGFFACNNDDKEEEEIVKDTRISPNASVLETYTSDGSTTEEDEDTGDDDEYPKEEHFLVLYGEEAGATAKVYQYYIETKDKVDDKIEISYEAKEAGTYVKVHTDSNIAAGIAESNAISFTKTIEIDGDGVQKQVEEQEATDFIDIKDGEFTFSGMTFTSKKK